MLTAIGGEGYISFKLPKVSNFGMLYHFNCLFFVVETLTFKQKFTIASLKEVNDHE